MPDYVPLSASPFASEMRNLQQGAGNAINLYNMYKPGGTEDERRARLAMAQQQSQGQLDYLKGPQSALTTAQAGETGAQTGLVTAQAGGVVAQTGLSQQQLAEQQWKLQNDKRQANAASAAGGVLTDALGRVVPPQPPAVLPPGQSGATSASSIPSGGFGAPAPAPAPADNSSPAPMDGADLPGATPDNVAAASKSHGPVVPLSSDDAGAAPTAAPAPAPDPTINLDVTPRQTGSTGASAAPQVPAPIPVVTAPMQQVPTDRASTPANTPAAAVPRPSGPIVPLAAAPPPAASAMPTAPGRPLPWAQLPPQDQLAAIQRAQTANPLITPAEVASAYEQQWQGAFGGFDPMHPRATPEALQGAVAMGINPSDVTRNGAVDEAALQQKQAEFRSGLFSGGGLVRAPDGTPIAMMRPDPSDPSKIVSTPIPEGNQTGPTGLTKYQENQINSQRDKYNDNNMTKEFHVASTAYQQLQHDAKAALSTPTTANDNLLLKTFARIDNPGMGVRESTVEMEMKNPGVFPGWFHEIWNKVARGGVLTPQQRVQIIQAAQSAYAGNAQAFQNYQQNEVLPQAMVSVGLDPSDAIHRKAAETMLFGQGATVPEPGAAPSTLGQPIGSPGGTYHQLKNGRVLYSTDGGKTGVPVPGYGAAPDAAPAPGGSLLPGITSRISRGRRDATQPPTPIP